VAIEQLGLRVRVTLDERAALEDQASSQAIAVVCDGDVARFCPVARHADQRRFDEFGQVSLLVVADQPSTLLVQQALAAGADAIIDAGTEPDEVVARLSACLRCARERARLRWRLDATEQRVAELAAALVDADRHAASGRLLGGIVHWLRTPLATATVSHHELVEVLQSQVPSVFESPLTSLGRSLERMSALLGDLAARVQRDRDPTVGRVELNELVTTEIAFLAIDPRIKHRVARELDLTDEETGVLGVEREIAQVIRICVLQALALVAHDAGPSLRMQTRVGDRWVTLRVQAVASEPSGLATAPLPSTGAMCGLSSPRALDVAHTLVAQAGGELRERLEPDGRTSLILSLPLASTATRRPSAGAGLASEPPEAE